MSLPLAPLRTTNYGCPAPAGLLFWLTRPCPLKLEPWDEAWATWGLIHWGSGSVQCIDVRLLAKSGHSAPHLARSANSQERTIGDV